MQFSTLSIMTLACTAFAAAAPVEPRDAACNIAVAASEVSCIKGCGKNEGCITDCTLTAVSAYLKCAGF
ncbi:uncharacterized protein BCR38DRAFT_525253 [Pseudomassariella vexata]|uniref:Extracellular membrane protein CFEM domain-containing protein n=1 Tax=Pseudomassariella vexata TaxID=1141098 RepID=A0A1Y2DSG4_9PEZI|nr:uncharacterized protein BCR38DRAFT_525253 [Pseudomassariella vexata]ORY62212.1 hypothetical protein BCR38DRAFT_525253 [Pseudomassariella vexata]